MTLPFTGERCVPRATPRDVFDQHASRYRFAFHRFLPGSVVVDIGSGSGMGTALLGMKCRRVVGVELDCLSVAFASHRFARHSPMVSFVRGDAQCLPFGNDAADGITAFEIIEHVPEPARLLDEAWRVLRPGGIMVASTPSGEADQYLENPFHISRLTCERFRTELARRFAVEEELYQGIVTRRRLLSLRLQARLRRFPLGSQLLHAVLSSWPLRRGQLGESPEEFVPGLPDAERWPLLPAACLPSGALPYIVVMKCRKE